jgi:hypothetical protein
MNLEILKIGHQSHTYKSSDRNWEHFGVWQNFEPCFKENNISLVVVTCKHLLLCQNDCPLPNHQCPQTTTMMIKSLLNHYFEVRIMDQLVHQIFPKSTPNFRISICSKSNPTIRIQNPWNHPFPKQNHSYSHYNN